MMMCRGFTVEKWLKGIIFESVHWNEATESTNSLRWIRFPRCPAFMFNTMASFMRQEQNQFLCKLFICKSSLVNHHIQFNTTALSRMRYEQFTQKFVLLCGIMGNWSADSPYLTELLKTWGCWLRFSVLHPDLLLYCKTEKNLVDS